MSEDTQQTTYAVTGMTCEHCAAAVTEEVSAVEAGTVVVSGDGFDDDLVRAAVDEAGYAVV